jgi:DNA polymerase eta
LALHLPIRTSNIEPEDDVPQNVEEAYNRTFRLSNEDRERIIKEEIGVRRFQHEGKACLERYRLASARIFQVISDSLTQILGKGNFLLERASIDELYIDVTSFCWGKENGASKSDDMSLELKDTVVVGDNDNSTVLVDDEKRVLVRGCEVAKMIRTAVFDILGFTLSAGISVNKMIAKLGATYGKPNGQAVIFPEFITKVLQKTPIGKVRNLGGKLGRRVQELLPSNENSLGAVASLSLPTLSAALGDDTSRWVFDVCRGIDHEKVKETERVLVKSVTASKSFPTAAVLSEEVQRWVSLLSQDIASRVEVDSSRNNRYPKNCTIHYAVSSTRQGPRTDRSLRISYPKPTLPEKAVDIAKRAVEVVTTKEGRNVFLSRIGLSATDFEFFMCSKSEGALDSFFQKPGALKSKTIDDVCPKAPETDKLIYAGTEQSDLLLAQRLQRSYDRENSLVAAMEKRRPTKKMRIDSFFQKRK